MILKRSRRVAIHAAVALLVAFHAILLWQRIETGTLLEPGVLLRWLGSLGLVFALPWLRRLSLGTPVRANGVLLTALLIAVLIHVPAPVVTGDAVPDGLLFYGSLSLALTGLLLTSILDVSKTKPARGVSPLRIVLPSRYCTPRSSRAPPFDRL